MKTRTPLERLKRKLTIETLWIYVLAAITSQGPTYAYNVKKIIKQEFGFTPSTVTLYTVIYRLEKEGYLKKQGNEYHITEKGKTALKQGIQLIENTLQTLKQAIGGSNGP